MIYYFLWVLFKIIFPVTFINEFISFSQQSVVTSWLTWTPWSLTPLPPTCPSETAPQPPLSPCLPSNTSFTIALRLGSACVRMAARRGHAPPPSEVTGDPPEHIPAGKWWQVEEDRGRTRTITCSCHRWGKLTFLTLGSSMCSESSRLQRW